MIGRGTKTSAGPHLVGFIQNVGLVVEQQRVVLDEYVTERTVLRVGVVGEVGGGAGIKEDCTTGSGGCGKINLFYNYAQRRGNF